MAVDGMSRTLSIVLALALFALGALLALYGFFAIVYRGDSGAGGSTYVTIAGHELDAGPIGLISLVLGAVGIFFATVLVRHRHRRAGPHF